VFDIYEATVLWDGTACRVAVDEVDVMPLVGMALLYGYELTVQSWRVEGCSSSRCLLITFLSHEWERTANKRAALDPAALLWF